MDVRGYRHIQSALSGIEGVRISPEPSDDSPEARFVGLEFPTHIAPHVILNALNDEGLMHPGSTPGSGERRPRLLLVGSSCVDATIVMTLEDKA